jgi:glutamyl-Q tRNA(Asp) synthetase
LLRIEDIDPPREESGATDRIITSLQDHGFRWTGEVVYQNRNVQQHARVVDELLARGHAYKCNCSRDFIRTHAQSGSMGSIYPGFCREKSDHAIDDGPFAIRLRTDNQPISFTDPIQGHIQCQVQDEIGDFIIRRKDGLVAYSLAVVLDDANQGITEIVRGADLLAFTPAQIYLQQVLNLDLPSYLHVPVARNPAGDKLSKQTGAAAIDDSTAIKNLFECLQFLKQAPPTTLLSASMPDFWHWATANWRPERIAK